MILIFAGPAAQSQTATPAASGTATVKSAAGSTPSAATTAKSALKSGAKSETATATAIKNSSSSKSPTPKKIDTKDENPAEVFSLPTNVGPKVRLKQVDIPRLVLEQGDRVQEANLKSELPRVDLARTLKEFDWTLKGTTGYEHSRFENLSGVGNIDDQILKTNIELTKDWTTGTTTSLSWVRNSYRSEYNPLSPAFTTLPAELTQDIFGFTLEQALWRNYFGSSDRRKVHAAELDLNAAAITRAQDLQTSVLEGLKAYWLTFMAQENLKQAFKSIERYEGLASTIRRKSGLGFAQPGELSQVQAELEMRRQTAKTAAGAYLREADRLIELLHLTPNSDLEFDAHVDIVPPPALKPVELERLRSLRAQSLKLESAESKLESSQSEEGPAFALVGQVYGSGLEEKASDSVGEGLSGARPKYYVGVKFEHNFGSAVQSEETVNKKALAELERLRLERLRLQTQNEMLDSERQTRTLYALSVSTKEQMALREKAYNEINRAYTQGRTDINFVVEALNRLFEAEVSYSRAIGDYQIALATWAARRDELIPDQGATR